MTYTRKPDANPRKDSAMMTQTATTIRDFVTENRITADVEWTDSNPNMADMPYGSNHYKVTLRFGRRRMTVPFSMGPAHTNEPTAAEVLDCLLSDASSADESFEDFCSNLGYDDDSRTAERIYKAVVRQSEKTRQFLGDLYETALHAERL